MYDSSRSKGGDGTHDSGYLGVLWCLPTACEDQGSSVTPIRRQSVALVLTMPEHPRWAALSQVIADQQMTLALLKEKSECLPSPSAVTQQSQVSEVSGWGQGQRRSDVPISGRIDEAMKRTDIHKQQDDFERSKDTKRQDDSKRKDCTDHSNDKNQKGTTKLACGSVSGQGKETQSSAVIWRSNSWAESAQSQNHT